MTELQNMIDTKLDQWESEKELAAMRAFKMGREAVLVQYPTGLLRMRFAEPFTDFGMHYEVSPEVWHSITNR